MYNYPITPTLFNELVYTNSQQHSMGESLEMYLKLKLHPYILCRKFDEIRIIGKFDRISGISTNEKKNKLFNWIRPTAFINNQTLEVRCFPGKD